jgi:hypothetical protein
MLRFCKVAVLSYPRYLWVVASAMSHHKQLLACWHSSVVLGGRRVRPASFCFVYEVCCVLQIWDARDMRCVPEKCEAVMIGIYGWSACRFGVPCSIDVMLSIKLSGCRADTVPDCWLQSLSSDPRVQFRCSLSLYLSVGCKGTVRVI